MLATSFAQTPCAARLAFLDTCQAIVYPDLAVWYKAEQARLWRLFAQCRANTVSTACGTPLWTLNEIVFAIHVFFARRVLANLLQHGPGHIGVGR